MPIASKSSVRQEPMSPSSAIETRWEIPKTWIWAKVGDIARIVGGGTPRASDKTNFATSGSGIGWITPADLTGYEMPTIEHGRRDLTERGLALSGAQILPPGAVLLSARAPIGYSVVSAAPLSTNQGFKGLLLRGGISPFYIRYYFIFSRSYLNSLGSGLTFAELSSRKIAEIPIPLPPLTEQHRIVARLQALEVRSQRARAHLVTVPAQLARTRQSLLSTAFSGLLTSKWRADNEHKADTWQEMTFSDLVSDLKQGWSPKCDSVPATPAEWGVIKTTAIQPLEFRPAENKRLPKRFEPIPNLSIQSGDVLVTRAGPRSRCAIAAIASESHPKLMVCDKVYRLRVNNDRVSATFFALLLNSPIILEMLEAAKTGTSESVMNITQEKLLRIIYKIPPIAEQHEIVRLVMAALARLDVAVAAHAAALGDLTRLEHSILGRAFRGQLAAQEPTDEPASFLLNRLKLEPVPKIMKKPQLKAIPPKETIRSTLDQIPGNKFTFEQLREHISADYETMRDELFDILGGPHPILRQEFDTERRSVYFVKT